MCAHTDTCAHIHTHPTVLSDNYSCSSVKKKKLILSLNDVSPQIMFCYVYITFLTIILFRCVHTV